MTDLWGSPESKKATLTAVALLVVAFAVRVLAAQYARFTGDESHQWATAVEIARGHQFPIFGQAITGSAARTPGPAFLYLMAIPQIFGSSPWLGTIWTVFLNVVPLWLLYLLGLQLRGHRAGLLALAVGTFSPWAIVLSEKIWSANVLPLWGAAALYAAVRSTESKRWQVVLLFATLTMPQVHMSAPALWVPCIVWLVVYPPKSLSWTPIAWGVGLTALTYSGAIVSELQTGFENVRLILEHSGGGMGTRYRSGTPLRVLGMSIGFGTSEFSYQLERGYWHTFKDLEFYFSPKGWMQWWNLWGPAAFFATLASIGLAVAAWGAAIVGTFENGRAAFRQRSRAALGRPETFNLALLASIASAAILMMMAGKKFYPHYIAFLVPMAIWPMADGLDRAWARARLRPAIALGLLVSIGSMGHNAARFYREVDALNSLRNTLAMVETVLEETAPFGLFFDAFNNSGSWHRLSYHHFNRPLPTKSSALVRYRVHNGEPYSGPVLDTQKIFGPVWLERTTRPDRPKGPGHLWRAAEHWEDIDVTAVHPEDDAPRNCVPEEGFDDYCAYGDQEWQHFGPEILDMAGRQRLVVFTHPITDGEVVAQIPLPPEASRGALYLGLSDDAASSTNETPVEVELTRGVQSLVRREVGNARGLKQVAFVLTATGARSLELRIRCDNDGARIFGWDLDLYR